LIIINYFASQQTLAQWQFVARGERLASVPIGVKHSSDEDNATQRLEI
jgi:hypothetical protein